MHSIRFKITAITVAAILASILCVYLVSVSTMQSENDRNSVEVMRLIGQDTRMSLENYTEGIEQSTNLIASLASDSLDSVMLVEGGVVGSGAEEGERSAEQVVELDSYLAEYIDRIEDVSSIIASHTHGIVTYYYCINPDVSTTERGFFYSRAGRSGFAEREQLDARALDPNDTEHTTWYYSSIDRGRPSWVGPYTAHFLDEMQVCSYLVPIYKSGTLVGVLGMDIPVETLVSLVSSIKVYDTGFACLLDAEGHVLYHPEQEFGTTLDAPADANLLQSDDSGDALIRYVHNGQDRQISFTTLSNGMKLVIIAPTAEVDASSIQLAHAIALVTVIIVVIFAIASMLAMRFLTRPLLRLTAASQRLAAADYDVELDYRSRDEVGVLTGAFEQMRDKLKANIEDLNRKVRTDDLTGLANQRYFFELAEKEKPRLIAEGKHPVMLYFNLIGMKHFNRQYGFDEGDRLICAVADVLSSQFGEACTARFGQDHFAVMADEDRLEERLFAVFWECQRANDGKTLPLSVGIYPNSLEDVDPSTACDRAKYACDQRKGTYTSGWRRFDLGMAEQVEVVRYVIDHLDEALENGWVQVYYQPIVRAANGRVCDEEALSRWIDPHRGMIPLPDFIPALENSGLIYKLDLYVLDRVLEKIKRQEGIGLPIVPHSVNLSRADFDSCDIVEEICRRVDAAGVGRDRITIEITESIIGRDFDFMKRQVERFQELGFPVWMDDFGSGYSSLDALQSISFDLIKFDMSFMRKLDEGTSGKIVLTELMKMATALGVDTVCEGVETLEQSRFLQEIGCSKLQGYYYSRPLPFEKVLERYEKGEQIGFENPEESAYFETIGKVNLYDMAVIANEGGGALLNIFNTIPMGIVEVGDGKAEFVRTNQSYRDFAERFFGADLSKTAPDAGVVPPGVGAEFMEVVRQRCSKGNRVLFDEQMSDGSIVHLFARRIGENPVSGVMAIALAVLSITEPGEGATYANIARALAVDFYNIYYVDLDTERFIEYSSPVGAEELAMERHGEDFFAASRRDTMTRIYEADREEFLATFTKDNVIRELDERGVFTASYRLIDTGEPMTVRMKITRMEPEGRHIIIGISIV